jgi:MoxR-like ATPase
MRSEELTLADVGRLAGVLLDELERAVVGKREALELVLLGILADGHVLIEDFPGLAKTLIARSFALVLTLDFKRIQFTPDLMPSDVTGSAIFNPRTPSSNSGRARSSPTCCWRTRSTAPPPRPSRLCWRRCRNGRSPSTA